jgi:hypothetical protein
VISWMHHWLWVDLWVPLWPNIVASAVLFACGYVYHRTVNLPHIRRVRELHEHHLGTKDGGS